MFRKSLVIPIFLVALQGCGSSSDDVDRLQFSMVDGRWRIELAEGAPDFCAASLTVTGSDGNTYWHISTIPIPRSPTTPKQMLCSGDFPIDYGNTPGWMFEESPPQPLKGPMAYYVTVGNEKGSTWLP